MPSIRPLAVAATLVLIVPTHRAAAQDNYEIQVYPGTTVPRGVTMVELHSNFTSRGSQSVPGGMLGTHHALHETIEITHGFNDWFEIGLYQFTSYRSGDGFQYVGNHIRPRVAIPVKWNWPVGLSLSQEIGYQRKEFSGDTWSWELRPIIDMTVGRLYWSVNPVLAIGLKGESAGHSPEFEPNVQVGFDVTSRVNLAMEYYGAMGTLSHFERLRDTDQMLMPALNIDFGPDWEFNLATGIPLTRQTDRVAFKLILGRRFGGK